MLENQDSLLNTLQAAENFARLAIVTFFGVSFFLNGLVLHARNILRSWKPAAAKVSRACYYIGTAFIIAFCTLEIVSPWRQTPILVNIGVSFVIAVMTLGLNRDNPGAPALHFLSGALIFLITSLSSIFFTHDVSAVSEFSWLTTLHIVTAIGGEGLFVVAFCSSLLYVWDYRRLKKKILERKPFLPSLDTLDMIVERTSLVGLFLISTSLISGLGLVFGGAGLTASLPKFVWAFTVWSWYVLAIFGREFLGWRGKKGAQLSIWGTAILVVALFGTLTRT